MWRVSSKWMKQQQHKPTSFPWGYLPPTLDLTKEATQHDMQHAWTIKLTQVKESDYKGCYEAVQFPDIWEHIPRPPPLGEEAFAPFFNDMIHMSNRFAFVIRDGAAIVGSTSYYDVNEPHRQLEIGYTHLRPDYWRTSVNTQAKLMMLQHAFEELNCIRVQFRTDEQNFRSRAALERIGAICEGIRRNDKILKDGRTRNCVFYSIVAEEWPEVKTKLLALLMRHDAQQREQLEKRQHNVKNTMDVTNVKTNTQQVL